MICRSEIALALYELVSINSFAINTVTRMKVNNGLAQVAANMNPKTKDWFDPLFPLTSSPLTGGRRHNVSRVFV